MSLAAEQVIATFAASIVISRGATTVAAIREAWSDARWILFPELGDTEYRAWQEAHGEVPCTLAEADAGAAAIHARKRHLAKAIQEYSTL
jgi:hypothetical protein